MEAREATEVVVAMAMEAVVGTLGAAMEAIRASGRMEGVVAGEEVRTQKPTVTLTFTSSLPDGDRQPVVHRDVCLSGAREFRPGTEI